MWTHLRKAGRLLPGSLRYINDDPDGVNNGDEGGTRNGTLLREFPLERNEGATYTIQGVVDLTDGYGDDNNRIGIYLFGNVANPAESQSGDLHLVINLANNEVSIRQGINGDALASTPKVGALQSDALIGTQMVLTADLVFSGGDIEILFSLLDSNSDLTTVSTTVSASQFTGNFFGFASRARTRGVSSANRLNTWTMDYRSFEVTNTGTPTGDSDGNGIADVWEQQYFGGIGLIDGTGDADGDGLLDFFEYIFGSDPTDASQSGAPLEAVAAEAGGGIVFRWSVAPGMVEGEHYLVRYSTDLASWNSLPVDANLDSIPGDPTQIELTLPESVGERAFIRLVKP